MSYRWRSRLGKLQKWEIKELLSDYGMISDVTLIMEINIYVFMFYYYF